LSKQVLINSISKEDHDILSERHHGEGLRLGTALVAAALFVASLLVVPIEAARAQSLDLSIIVSTAQAQALIARGARFSICAQARTTPQVISPAPSASRAGNERA